MDRVTLRDGSQIVLRPIEPDDRDALAEGHRRLSPESRYRRFFASVPELSARDLDYLTRVDHRDHEALMAFDADTAQAIGVARFVRTAPGVAEPAMVVADDWQGRGVATVLLDALVARALAEGVERFVAPVLADNPEAMRVLQRLGDTVVRPMGREVELEVALAPGPGAPARLVGLMRAAAAGTVAPARTVLDLLLPRRRGAPGDPRGNRIVVGTDGSPDAQEAVRAAADLALATGAGLHVVGVHRLLLPDAEEVRDVVGETARELRGRGLQVYEHVRRGDPAAALADVAEEEAARLVVVGAGGRGGALRRVLGSTAGALTERAPCDVLIVRRPRPYPI
jgi:nucleotide-binding universal stress UspA family protein/RimJ/RimL family protein N-acetyltransferase